jgi:hypothetical protein
MLAAEHMSPATQLRARLPEIKAWLVRRIPLDLSMLVLDHLRMSAADAAPWPQAVPPVRGHIAAPPASAKPLRPARELREALLRALADGHLPERPLLGEILLHFEAIEHRASEARRIRRTRLEAGIRSAASCFIPSTRINPRHVPDRVLTLIENRPESFGFDPAHLPSLKSIRRVLREMQVEARDMAVSSEAYTRHKTTRPTMASTSPTS